MFKLWSTILIIKLKFVYKTEVITYDNLPELIKEKYEVVQQKIQKDKKALFKEQIRIKRLNSKF